MPDIPIQAQWLTAQQAVLGSVLIDAKCADAVLADTRPGDYTGVYREIYLVIQSWSMTVSHRTRCPSSTG